MFRVTDKPIDLLELVAYVSDPEAGAIATLLLSFVSPAASV